jgi:hypothetical protein
MTTIRTTVHEGHIQLNERVDFPDGSEVEVTVRPAPADAELRGMTEEEQGTSPEAVERWIAHLESLDPPTMTDDEWAAWMKQRADEKAWNLAREAEREARLCEAFK